MELSPKLILAIALQYVASADGNIDEDETTHLISIMHSDSKIIMQADKYIRYAIRDNITFDDFLDEGNKKLSYTQKECIILNMIDMMLVNNVVDVYEEKLIKHVVKKFDIDMQKYQVYKELMIKKNDVSVFED